MIAERDRKNISYGRSKIYFLDEEMLQEESTGIKSMIYLQAKNLLK